MHFEAFLREVAPSLGLQWRSFQRRGVKRKVERRMAEIGLPGLEPYLFRVRNDPAEKTRLSEILSITISRFFRDKEVFDAIENLLIPMIIKNKKEEDFKIWSIGCARGEEPYTLSLLWEENFRKDWLRIRLSVLATDIDEKVLERAKEGRYKKSGLKEVPKEILGKYFRNEKGLYALDKTICESVQFRIHDLFCEEPFPGMDLIFCRNLAFTYFSKEGQIDVLKKIHTSLKEEGYLVIGKDEILPLVYPTLFVPVFPMEKIYRRFNRNDPPHETLSI